MVINLAVLSSSLSIASVLHSLSMIHHLHPNPEMKNLTLVAFDQILGKIHQFPHNLTAVDRQHSL